MLPPEPEPDDAEAVRVPLEAVVAPVLPMLAVVPPELDEAVASPELPVPLPPVLEPEVLAAEAPALLDAVESVVTVELVEALELLLAPEPEQPAASVARTRRREGLRTMIM